MSGTAPAPTTAPPQQVVEEIKAAGGDAVANYESCSNCKAAEDLINQAVDSFGGLDILVNNAGILRDKMSYNMAEDDWDSVIDVHLKGHFATTHFAGSYWRARSKAGDAVYGRVINTSSESGLFGNAGQANYAAAKAGIVVAHLGDRARVREDRRDRQRDRAAGPHPDDREDLRRLRRDRGRRVRRLRPGERLPRHRVAGEPRRGDVTGQVFVVWGSEVQVAKGFTLGGSVDAGGKAWTVDGLIEAQPKLFANHDSGIPPFQLV